MFASFLISLSKGREPIKIGGKAEPYMLRWPLVRRNSLANVYLHNMLKSDEDRALHDHPYGNVSIVLRGGYWELMPVDVSKPTGATRKVWRAPGSIVFRRATASHRAVLNPGTVSWSLFLTGPRVREWGFWCPAGWRHWKDFTDFRSGGNGNGVGPGCD